MDEEEVISEAMHLLNRMAVALELMAESVSTAVAAAEQLERWEPTGTEIQSNEPE